MEEKQKNKICVLSTMYLRYKNDTRGLMVQEYCRHLADAGHEVHVVAPNDGTAPSYEIMDNIHVHRFSYFFPKRLQRLAYGAGIPTNLRISWLAKLQVPFFALAFILKAFFVARKCDILHCQWVPTSIVGALINKVLKKKMFVTVRAVPWNKGIKKKLSKFGLSNATHVFGNSSFTLKKALEVTNLKSCSVYHNSIDLIKFNPDKSNNVLDVRKKHGIHHQSYLIFTMGLLVEKKGFEYLIEAYKILKKLDDRFRLIIGGSGPREKQLKKLAEGTDIIFTGKIEANETPTYFRECEFFVLPSIYDRKGETETLGVVLLEAMACGKTCIASNVGGIPDVVKNNYNGLLVPEKDVNSLVLTISILRKDEEYKKQLEQTALKDVRERFGWRQEVERFYQ